MADYDAWRHRVREAHTTPSQISQLHERAELVQMASDQAAIESLPTYRSLGFASQGTLEELSQPDSISLHRLSELRAELAERRAAIQSIQVTDMTDSFEVLKEVPESDEMSAQRFSIIHALTTSIENICAQARSIISQHARIGSREDFFAIQNDNSANSIYDESEFWFGYQIAVRMKQNMSIMTEKLSNMKHMQEMLDSEATCPMCLETIQPESSKTLDCFHKTCTNCWNHWSRHCHGNPSCPLCRREFQEAIVSF